MAASRAFVIRNATRNTGLAQRAAEATSLWARTRGLLGRRALQAGAGLLIQPCSSIHTWFMRFPIDVMFVDQERRIVKTSRGLRPYRFSGVLTRQASVLELPAGVIEHSGGRPGDQLVFEA